MLMRSGSFARPNPLVEFDCGSQSTRSDLTSAAAKEAARLMAVVVLPTPPFWFATAITRPMGSGRLKNMPLRDFNEAAAISQCRKSVQLFYVEHLSNLRFLCSMWNNLG